MNIALKYLEYIAYLGFNPYVKNKYKVQKNKR